MAAPAASGIFKQLRIDAESTYGVAPTASDAGAYILRRVTCDIAPNIATFKSAEIRPDRQLVTFRHGTQQVRGTLRGELSPESYQDIFASLLAGAWTAGATTGSGLHAITVTYVAANFTGPVPATITRASGSFLTDGFKWGDIVRITNSTVTANNNRNYRILGLTATVMTVSRTPTSTADAALINASLEALAAGSDASTSTLLISVVGAKLSTPDPFASGTLLDPSFTLEQYFADQSVYELYTGNKVSEARLAFTPSGLSTIDATFMGSAYTTGTGEYFTEAQAADTTQALTGVSGTIRVDDLDLGLITSMQMNIMGGHTVDPVIGTPFVNFVYPGIIDISGTLSILFYDETFFNVAINETLVDLLLVQTVSPGLANSDFLSFRMNQIKLNSVTKDDGPKAIIGTYSFQALKETAGGSGTEYDNSTLIMQDSTLS
jgi:hypothetical protein